MKKILLFSPAISSMNVGDEIIVCSAKKELSDILEKNFVTEVSTHLPMSIYYMRYLKNVDLRLVLGSNLLKSTFFGLKRQWDITFRISHFIRPVVLVGAGWWQYNNKPNFYTKMLLKRVLSKDVIHSVRDEYTLEVLKSMGISNVVNTSCPTMWSLTKEHCEEIPKLKSNKVVVTLTDYSEDFEKDIDLLTTLLENYDEVALWPQGMPDMDYFNRLDIPNKEKIIILNPSLKAYDDYLSQGVDYIGTRLHGGIRALQYKCRTLIVAVDNRAIEKRKSFNLPVIERREQKEKLEKLINGVIDTDIVIPSEKINHWRSQFGSFKE